MTKREEEPLEGLYPYEEREISQIATLLAVWYRQNARKLPWRGIADPYQIWLSEVILQQTRIEQGTSYYLSFIEAFPSVTDLAKASEDEVLRLWQGLGYYSRARNLHKTAQIVATQYHGQFPADYALLRALPGIGDYTAGAIASFAFGQSYPAVDGNLLRLLSRLFADETPIDSSQGKKLFYTLAQAIVSQGNSAILNQAMMDIGATLCTPLAPSCTTCPLCDYCKVAGLPIAKDLPIKKRKQPLRDRYLYFIYITDPLERTLLAKRTAQDIWRGLYQLPLIESSSPLSQKELYHEIKKNFGEEVLASLVPHHSLEAHHILSHRRLHLSFFKAPLQTPFQDNTLLWGKYKIIRETDLGQYALPAAIFKYLPKLLEEGL